MYKEHFKNIKYYATEIIQKKNDQFYLSHVIRYSEQYPIIRERKKMR